MTVLECITLAFTFLFLGSILAVALYYDYKLREKRVEKFSSLMDTIEKYVSVNTNQSND